MKFFKWLFLITALLVSCVQDKTDTASSSDFGTTSAATNTTSFVIPPPKGKNVDNVGITNFTGGEGVKVTTVGSTVIIEASTQIPEPCKKQPCPRLVYPRRKLLPDHGCPCKDNCHCK